jgi:plastocyanin
MALALVSARLAPVVSASGSLEVVVKDERGKPISDAVISLTQAGGSAPPFRLAAAVMDQQNRMFVPVVLAVPVGTAVTFPNRDDIRHHVYSFSRPKPFELPLYMGLPAAPVVFDKPGVVVLGCNIHDWMVAYIYVSATPHFAKTTDDGVVRLADVAPGTYEARVWHRLMRGEPEKSGKPITITAGDPGRLEFTLALKFDRRRPAPPPLGSGWERPQS